jgi:radical SAM superfamily enzyme YgiQ (UPF0313 family)/pyrimidine deaminase RibD-like protein
MTDEQTKLFADLLEAEFNHCLTEADSLQKDKALMAQLLAFTKGPTDPFDDPYVGAALFTADYKLLGAYRKTKAGERHSEPETILQALRSCGDKRADDLLIKIEAAYRDKMWIQKNSRPDFEKLFQEAGSFLKAHHNAKGLILFSSLEPCGKYEANPSCAHIICACKIDRVLYASDDTNPKGWGRPFLEESKVLVVPNMMAPEAVSINSKHFACVNICLDAYRDYSVKRLFGGAPYSIFRADAGLFTTSIDAGRLKVRATDGLTVHYVGAEHEVLSGYMTKEEIRVANLGSDNVTTLFYGGSSLGELSKLLYRFTQINGKLPGTIITPTDPFSNIDGSNLELSGFFARLRDRSDIVFHRNAFRKHHELWSMNRHLRLAGFRSEFSTYLAALVKVVVPSEVECLSPYKFHFTESDDLVPALVKQCSELKVHNGHAARITIIGNEPTHSRIIEQLKSMSAYRELFNRSSFEVGVIPHRDSNSISAALERLKTETRLITSLTVSTLGPQELGSTPTARQLDDDIRSGRRDVNFFGPGYIDELSRGVDWVERRSAGTITGQLAKSNPEYAEAFVLSTLSALARRKFDGDDWTEACSKLNAVRNAADVLRRRDRLQATIDTLNAVAYALEELATEGRPSWFEDLAWRWLACWFEFPMPDEMPPNLADSIRGSPFLLSSAVHYSFRSERPWALHELKYLIKPLYRIDPSSFAAYVNAARLAASGEWTDRTFSRKRWAWIRAFSMPVCWPVFKAEYKRCVEARAAELLGLADRINEDQSKRLVKLPDEAADYVRSHTAQRAIGDRLGNLLEPDEFEPDFRPLKAWREDHRVILEDVISYIPRAWRPAVLRALAGDSDVNLRWAAVYLALRSPKISELFGAPSAVRDAQVVAFQTDVVSVAREAGNHYWIERVVLDGYLTAHDKPGIAEPGSRTRSFPSAANLGLDTYLKDRTDLHPELIGRVARLRAQCKRILLILPPIDWPESDLEGVVHRQRNQGSPPLGLGQIAAALAAAGHYVEVMDAHRYVYGLNQVAEKCLSFDFVGLSVVFSTLDSANELTTQIAQRSGRASGPCVVVGGHAATLDPKRLLKGHFFIRYLVIGPGENAFQDIVSAESSGSDLHNECVVKVPLSDGDQRSFTKVRFDSVNGYGKVWDGLPLIDRSVYISPNKISFEPAVTRNGISREAHFVMSKGCDWSCTFCTEAILTGSREVRRDALAVVDEVAYVVEHQDVGHAQFIDDNVFPPLAAPKLNEKDRKERLEWTNVFLSRLRILHEWTRKNSRFFSWRGLVRIEDLLAYKKCDDDFIKKLAESGCGLIAFGVEHGNETVRRELKGNIATTPTNREICELIASLRSFGIRSKAYFMVGGTHDSHVLAQETIDFALSSGVDLAYFAIFKDFRGLSKKDAARPAHMPKFGQFAFDLATVAADASETKWHENFGPELRDSPEKYTAALRELSALNFEFSSLFKYGDIHLDEALDCLYFNSKHQYYRVLRRAYLEFYARIEWVNVYRDLIANGY